MSSIARAGRSQPLERLLEPRAHLVVEQIAEVAARHGQPQAVDRHRRRRLRCGVAEQRVIHEAGVGDALRQRPDVVERARQRHHAVGRDFAERRLEPDDAAGGGGNADRAAGIGADRGERHAGRDADRRSAARSAWRSRRIVRVARRPERRVLVGRAERELVQVGLADEHRAGLRRCAIAGASRLRDMAVAHARRGGRRRAADVEQILDRDRHAVQRSAVVAGGELAIGLARLAAAPRRP